MCLDAMAVYGTKRKCPNARVFPEPGVDRLCHSPAGQPPLTQLRPRRPSLHPVCARSCRYINDEADAAGKPLALEIPDHEASTLFAECFHRFVRKHLGIVQHRVMR
jgi:hypothetical protein